MKKSKWKKIAFFSDGRPGHEKQSLGLLKQLEKRYDIDCLTIEIGASSFLAQVISLIRYFCGIGGNLEHNLSDFDLILGTGTHTHLPMLLYKQQFKVPVVTCMTPASYLIDKFDIIFSPQHDKVKNKSNIVTTVGPPSTNENEKGHDSGRVLILVGGLDKKSHDWKTIEIVDIIKKIVANNSLKKYVISSSPRTPLDTIQQLESYVKNSNNAEFHNFKDTPSGWVERQYGLSETVWVTADSISMVYEALSSGCKVGLIPVNWKKISNKFRRSEEYIRHSGHVIDLDQYLTGKDCFDGSRPLNEAKRCADEIIGRLAWLN